MEKWEDEFDDYWYHGKLLDEGDRIDYGKLKDFIRKLLEEQKDKTYIVESKLNQLRDFVKSQIKAQCADELEDFIKKGIYKKSHYDEGFFGIGEHSYRTTKVNWELLDNLIKKWRG